MKISLKHISKKFQGHWIFKDINYVFEAPAKVSILGPNGSGKSTLLRIIAGMQSSSYGEVIFDNSTLNIQHSALSYCAPGMDIPEELTLLEFFQFHFALKEMLPGMSIESILRLTGLYEARHKAIDTFSSGMKQRVKLAQAIFSNTTLLLLDEPCTNLDEAGMQQYADWIDNYTNGRLIIVASNNIKEYYFCQDSISLEL